MSLKYLSVGPVVDLDFVAVVCVTGVVCEATSRKFVVEFWNSLGSVRDSVIAVSQTC
jgi:hypothetical protein